MPPFTSATRANRFLARFLRFLRVISVITCSSGHVLAALSLGTAVGACFNPPAQAVMFSCTPDDAVCPGGYSCEADGCCHRDGSDIEANFGGCGLGQGPGASDPGTDTTAAPTTTSATTGEPDPSTSSSTSSDTSTSTGTTGDTSGTTADTGTDTGSSSAGTTGSTGSIEPANL